MMKGNNAVNILVIFICCISFAFCESMDFDKACSPTSTQKLTAEEGEIYSPGFKENKPYPLNTICTFELSLVNNKNIIFEVKFMDIENSAGCYSQDGVQIYYKRTINQMQTENVHVRNYCGSNFTERVLILANLTKTIYVHFKSDFIYTGRGFLLHYKYTTQTSLCGKAELECKNSFCIPSAAICNQKDDCGDGTDEENCKKLDQYVECGSPIVDPDLRIESRIVGGKEVLPGSWPWQVSIQDGIIMHGGRSCGGSLINSQYIVSAAHCINEKPGNRWRIRLGIHSEYQKEEYMQVRYVESIHVVDYRVLNGTNSDLMSKDIALLRLNAEVKFNNHVRPVCLPKQDFHIKAGTICYATGWGKTRGSGASSLLKQVTLKILETCKMYYDPTSIICADSYNDDGGTCHGDSGGPLVCKVDEKWQLIGVSSYLVTGTGKTGVCGVQNHPSGYQRVSAHVQWIEDVVKTEK